ALALLVAACGGAADEQPPAVAPPPPAATTPPPVDTAPPPTAEAPPPAAKPSMPDMQLAMLKTFPTVFTDAAKVAALYAADAQLMVAGLPPASGREAIQAAHQQFIDTQSNLKLTPTRAWQKGNQVACEWVLTGTQTKEWQGMP